MLAKLTSRNQLTLPKSVVESLGVPECFGVELRGGQVLLTPVRIQRGDAVRAKLQALGLSADDVADAVRWARGEDAAPLVAAEPTAPRYRGSKRAPAPGKKAATPRRR